MPLPLKLVMLATVGLSLVLVARPGARPSSPETQPEASTQFSVTQAAPEAAAVDAAAPGAPTDAPASPAPPVVQPAGGKAQPPPIAQAARPPAPPAGGMDDRKAVAPAGVDLRTGCPASLQQGSTGPCVSELQRLLNGHGARLVVDGTFTPGTEAAVRDFQSARHLPVNGIVGQQTKIELYQATAPAAPAQAAAPMQAAPSSPASQQVDLRTACGMIRPGWTGSCVSTLQHLLNTVSAAGLAEDGDFGPLTEAAVRRFQAARHLEVDGIVGDQTKDALYGQTAPPVVTPVSFGGGGGSAIVNAARADIQQHIPYWWAGGHGDRPGPSFGSCSGYPGPTWPCRANQHVGLDCSGFARYAIWQAMGIDLFGNTDTQFHSRHAVHITYAQRQPGDLIYYGSWNHTHHVAIYTGYVNGREMMAEEPGQGFFAREVPLRTGDGFMWVHVVR